MTVFQRPSTSLNSVTNTLQPTVLLLWNLLIVMMSSGSQKTIQALASVPTTTRTYKAPKWAKDVLLNAPQRRLSLANLPTPLYEVKPSPQITDKNDEPSILQGLVDLNVSLFIKRDDMTGGVELGGNKIRKLEFLLAHALEKNADSVVTIGGEQSNHCRATAAACRMVGLEPHLILRTKRANSVCTGEEENFGFTGNILFDRMVGSQIYTCTPGEYGRVGSKGLVERLCNKLKKEKNRNPYPIPVGGSNGLGSWGYINGVEELMTQWNSEETKSLDHVVFACGSGGTAAGIALGLGLSKKGDDVKEAPHAHAVGVCDDPDYFYNYVAEIANDMGFKHSSMSAVSFIRQHMTVHQGKGLGYASSTAEELNFCTRFALETGIVLDPVYSGKAMFHFMTQVLDESFRGKNILFWHTGGSLGMYDKGQDLLETMDQISPVTRLDVYDKGGQDGMLSI